MKNTKNQILGYRINKNKKLLDEATNLILQAAGKLADIDPCWRPKRLDPSADYLLDIAMGFMDISDNYAALLLQDGRFVFDDTE